MRSKAATGWGTALAVIGVLCLVAAAVLAWVVVPDRKQLPADTNTTRTFDGTARVLLNPAAVATGDMRNALLTNVPVTAERNVKVIATDGDTAQVTDSRTLTADGQSVGQTEATYAVDRTSLEAAPPASGWNVTPHEGLTVSWPIGAEQRDYTAWVNETQTTTTARFVREEERGGVNTYVYQADAEEAPIKDEAVLSALPPALPLTALQALSAVLPIPDEQKAQLAQALPSLNNPVPLTYTYESTSTLWVEPTTGVVVDTERTETRKAGIGGPGGRVLATVPIYSVDTSFAEQSVADAASDANDAKSEIQTYGTTLPWILTGLGVVLLIVGIVLIVLGMRRRPSGPGGPAAVPGQVPGSP
jgi:hypothetical protein